MYSQFSVSVCEIVIYKLEFSICRFCKWYFAPHFLKRWLWSSGSEPFADNERKSYSLSYVYSSCYLIFLHSHLVFLLQLFSFIFSLLYDQESLTYIPLSLRLYMTPVAGLTLLFSLPHCVLILWVLGTIVDARLQSEDVYFAQLRCGSTALE